MTATVQIAGLTAAVDPADSTARASSRSAQAAVLIADVSAESASSVAAVEIADVSATVLSDATVQLADVRAYAVADALVWTGSQWAEITADGVSVANAHSTGTGTSSLAGETASSAGSARSAGSGRAGLTGSIAITAAPSLNDSGIKDAGAHDFLGVLGVAVTPTLRLTGSAVVGPPGAGSLTITPNPANVPPRMLIDLKGALGSTVTISRVDAAGNTTPIRLANPGELSGGAWVGYDYEAPFGQPVRYRAVADQSNIVITSDDAMLDVSAPWLIHPGLPDLSVPLSVAKVGDRTMGVNQGVFNVLGRSDAVTVTDYARQSPVFDLQVLTGTQEAEDALQDLLADSSALLLQIIYPDIRRTIYRWVSIGPVTQSWLVEDYYGSDDLMWTLPCTVTSRPSGLLQSQRTWADVVAENATWADVVTRYATWRDVIVDDPIDV